MLSASKSGVTCSNDNGAKEFKFNQSDRNELLSAWQRKSEAGKANNFLDAVERILWYEVCDSLLPPETQSPQAERNDSEKIADLAVRLKGALVNLSPTSEYSYRAHLHDIGRAKGKGQDSDNILDNLILYLHWLEFVAKSKTDRPVKPTDRIGDASRYALMVSLVTTYQRYFNKNPSSSPTGNFQKFLKTLSGKIEIPLGIDLFNRALHDYKI